ncbi:hypothetical protein F2P79_013734 [Pimephales promelas]|nr:hypothetical protein F2P79_013734 [Pimephales promelas]
MCSPAHQTVKEDMGQSGVSSMPTMLQVWNPRAHSELLLNGTGIGKSSGQSAPAPPNKPSSSSELESGQNQPQNICRHPGHAEGLAVVGGLGALERQLKFPNQVVPTSLRPDVVLLSESTKQELTVPREDRLEEAFERELAKYEGLVSECRLAGWRTRCLPIEEGSLSRVFSLSGIDGMRRRRAIRNTTEAAEKASRWLWLKRGDLWGRVARFANWTQAGV